MNIVKKFSRFLPFIFLVVLFAGCSCPLCSKDGKSSCDTEKVACDTAETSKSEAGDVVAISAVDELESLKTSSKNLIMKFFAPWCPPCRAMEPIDKEMASKFVGDVEIVKIDIDKVPGAAQNYGVQGVPTYVYFKDGKEVERTVGGSGAGEYESKIKKTFGL